MWPLAQRGHAAMEPMLTMLPRPARSMRRPSLLAAAEPPQPRGCATSASTCGARRHVSGLPCSPSPATLAQEVDPPILAVEPLVTAAGSTLGSDTSQTTPDGATAQGGDARGGLLHAGAVAVGEDEVGAGARPAPAAMARPRPCAAPETTATRPVRSKRLDMKALDGSHSGTLGRTRSATIYKRAGTFRKHWIATWASPVP